MSVGTANAAPEVDVSEVSDDACKQLWCEVLRQAVDDAKAPMPVFKTRDWAAIATARNATKSDRKWTADAVRTQAARDHANEVAAWERDRDYIGSRSFKQVCWLCGLDPDAVEWRVRQQMDAAA